MLKKLCGVLKAENITFFVLAQIENQERNDENEVEVNRIQPVICSSASEVDIYS